MSQFSRQHSRSLPVAIVRQPSKPRESLRFLLIALIAGSCLPEGPEITAGSGGEGGGSGAGGDVGEVRLEPIGESLSALVSWAEFSPDEPSTAPIALAEPTMTTEVVEEVRQIDENGDVQVIPDVSYSCMETPFSLTQSPQAMVMNDPNRDILYPGALLQGRTHRDGANVGDLLPLTIPQRAPIRLSIPDVSNPNGANFRTVTANQAEVSAAVGDIVGNATKDNLNTPSTTSFEMVSYHSEQQFALQTKASGRYLGFKGSAQGSSDRNASQTTIAVQFAQRMFTAVVEPPGSGPESFFSEDFTPQLLQREKDAGRISSDNLPVYVSSVVYGRMMTFTMTSSASESELKATLRASYNSLAGGASLSLSAKQKKILEESTVSLTTLGGDAEGALSVIRSGDWSAYFSEDAPLSTAAPLSYTFKNLGNGSIASVAETSEFSVKTCSPVALTPGAFVQQPVAEFELDMGNISEVVVADFNGDDVDDIAYNSRSGTDNQIVILYSQGDGTFRQGPVQSFGGNAGDDNWANFQLAVADITGNGSADFVWNYNTANGERRSVTYTGMTRPAGNASGALQWGPREQLVNPSIVAGSYNLLLADMNDDGKADRLLNSAGVQTANYTHIGFSRGDGTFAETDGASIKYGGIGYVNYRAFVGDYTGDRVPDLVWNVLRVSTSPLHKMRSKVSTGIALEDLTPADVFDNTIQLDGWTGDVGVEVNKNWIDFEVLSGDVSGEGRMDLVWFRENVGDTDETTESTSPSAGDDHSLDIATALGTASGFVTQQFRTYTAEDLGFPTLVAPTLDTVYTYLLADVAGDDKDDLIINLRNGTINRVVVGISNGDGSFEFGGDIQELDEPESWSQFELVTGNFGGSAKKDIAWIERTGNAAIYVSIAK